MEIKYTTFTEKGIRTYNQDVFKVITSLEEHKALFIVCDGMGGHVMGDVAVQTVGDAITCYWKVIHKRMIAKTKL